MALTVADRLALLAAGFFITSIALFALVWWNHVHEKKIEKIIKRIERMQKLR